MACTGLLYPKDTGRDVYPVQTTGQLCDQEAQFEPNHMLSMRQASRLPKGSQGAPVQMFVSVV